MSAKLPTSCTVVSYPPSENGPGKAYLRLVGEGEEITLPVQASTLTHRNFILATWVKSYLPTLRKWLGDSKALTLAEASCAETLWEQTLIVTSEDGFTVHAWVAGQPGVLHYVYVPPDLRGKGIARALIQHVCGHTFEYGRPWPFKKAPNGGSYNPYLLGSKPEPKGGV
jgi:GNAT superfamily N-acetyltransferase